jgi:hypothetical protein
MTTIIWCSCGFFPWLNLVVYIILWEYISVCIASNLSSTWSQLDAYCGVSGVQYLICCSISMASLSYIRTTWTGRMVSVLAGHGNHLSTPVRTSETSADNYFTWQYIPEYNSELHTRRLENLKSHKVILSYTGWSTSSYYLISWS